MSKVSIILVNYNGQQFIENCLKSILNYLQNTDYEVIIVDNCSSDDSTKIIKDGFPFFQLICSNTNLGFGRANNLAVKYAQGEYLLFLNTDTILLENTPKILSDYLKQNREVGAIGARITFQDGSYQLSCGKLSNLIVELLYKIRATLDNRWHSLVVQKTHGSLKMRQW